MRNRIAFIALLPICLTPALLHAQTGGGAGGGSGAGTGFGGGVGITAVPTCDAGRPAASLGFAYFLPATVVAGSSASAGARGGTISGRAMPRTPDALPDEPLIGNIDDNGPAANRVQEGDRIARVNGFPITTVEGTSALRNAQPGRSLVLTLRRGDRMMPVTVTPTGWRCPLIRDAVLGATSASGRAAAISATTVAGGLSGATYAAGTLARTPSNAGWLGLGFDCTSCGQRATPNGRVWYFNEPPVIYNVDTGSPAYNAGIRRGDVLLRIDGKDINLPEAGARLGLVKPGETLRLTYRRDGRKLETSLKVATSPVFQRNAIAMRSAGELLKSTQELRLSTSESRVKAMMSELERSKAVQQRNLKELETSLTKQSGNNAQETLNVLRKLRSTEEAQRVREKQILTEMLKIEQEGSRKLDLVEQQMKHATVEVRPSVYMLDSLAFTQSAARDQRLRYSGSVGDADVEVRGPGSVSVQGSGDDIVIVTSDAVIRIKNRKVRDRIE